MINEQIETVHTKIQNDPSLKQRLEGVADESSYVNLLVEVAKANGINMSAADVSGTLQKVRASRPVSSAELSDSQLSSVAGGGFFSQWYYERFTSGYVKC